MLTRLLLLRLGASLAASPFRPSAGLGTDGLDVLSVAPNLILLRVWRWVLLSTVLCAVAVWVYLHPRKLAKQGEHTLVWYLFQDAHEFTAIASTLVTFLLSFFNATAFTRWWKLREPADAESFAHHAARRHY